MKKRILSVIAAFIMLLTLLPTTAMAAGTDTARAVSWAVDYGVTKRTGGTTFSPKSTCTRAEIVTFLHRDAKNP